MKRLLTILIAFVCLTSCDRFNYSNEGVSEEVSDNNRFIATKFEFGGHKYIQFLDKSQTMCYDEGIGYVHDPDCPCHQNETTPNK